MEGNWNGKAWNGELSKLSYQGEKPPSQAYRNLTGGRVYPVLSYFLALNTVQLTDIFSSASFSTFKNPPEVYHRVCPLAVFPSFSTSSLAITWVISPLSLRSKAQPVNFAFGISITYPCKLARYCLDLLGAVTVSVHIKYTTDRPICQLSLSTLFYHDEFSIGDGSGIGTVVGMIKSKT